MDSTSTYSKHVQMVDDKEKTRREIEILKQEVVKDLETFRGEFHGMADSLVAAKEAAQESNAHLGKITRHNYPMCWAVLTLPMYVEFSGRDTIPCRS